MSTPAPNFKHQDKQPWYKNYMVVIFVIGMPAAVVIACIWFVYYSYQIRDSVVRDDWYMDGKINIDDLITHKMPLEDINKAFDLMHSGESIRSVVEF